MEEKYNIYIVYYSIQNPTNWKSKTSCVFKHNLSQMTPGYWFQISSASFKKDYV